MKLKIKQYSWVFKKKLQQIIKDNAQFCSGKVIDIGCGEKPYLHFFKPHCTNYFGLDLPFSPLVVNQSVDIFADATLLPLKANVADTVVCFEVLDDIPEPSSLFSEINRILKPDGMLFLSVPQMWNIHNAPYDFYRYTRYGLTYQAKKHGFEVVSITGIGSFWARIAAKFCRFVYRFGFNRFVLKAVELCIIPFQFFFLIMDKMFFSEDDVICNLMIAKKLNEENTKKNTFN